jgi:hypothetical protein
VPTRSAEAQLFKTFSMRSLGSSRVVEAEPGPIFLLPCVSVEALQHPHGWKFVARPFQQLPALLEKISPVHPTCFPSDGYGCRCASYPGRLCKCKVTTGRIRTTSRVCIYSDAMRRHAILPGVPKIKLMVACRSARHTRRGPRRCRGAASRSCEALRGCPSE